MVSSRIRVILQLLLTLGATVAAPALAYNEEEGMYSARKLLDYPEVRSITIMPTSHQQYSRSYENNFDLSARDLLHSPL